MNDDQLVALARKVLPEVVAEIDRARSSLKAMKESLREVELQLASAERDAERYRFFRLHDPDTGVELSESEAAEMDRVIDAAMAARATAVAT